MKKIWLLGAAICLAAVLAGCSDKTSGDEGDGTKGLSSYIEPAQMTEEEKNIAALLGLNVEHHIFDFVLDGAAGSLQVNTYELSEGEWKRMVGGKGQAFTDTKGRIALGFDKIAQGLRVAVQSEGTNGATSYNLSEAADDFDGMGCATSFLSDRTEIVYDREIPLVVQIITAKNQIASYAVESFGSPEQYAEYEHVYAITVCFSQKTVSEASSEN